MKRYNLKKSEVVGALWEVMKIDVIRANEIRNTCDELMKKIVKPAAIIQPVEVIEDILNKLNVKKTEEIVYVSYLIGAILSRLEIGYLNKRNN